MPVNVPPNLPNVAASAIVRQAEKASNAEAIAKRQAADDKRRRDEALRAASNKRSPGTSQR